MQPRIRSRISLGVAHSPACSVFGIHEEFGNLGASVGLSKGTVTDSTPSSAENITVTATVVTGATALTPPTCDGTTTGTEQFPGTLNTALASTTDFTVAAGGCAWVCFEAELDSAVAGNQAVQGLTSTATWVFDGESV